MKRKSAFKAIIITTCIVLLCSFMLLFSACSLIGGPNVDERDNIVKPSVIKLGQDFDSQKAKKTTTEVSVILSIFKKDENGSGVIPFSVEQKAQLTRKINGDKFFADGKIKTVQIDNKVEELYKTIRLWLADDKNPYDAKNDPTITYLEGNTEINFALGATANGSYNLVAQYDKESYRLAVADETIANALYDNDFSLLNLLTSSGMLDFKNASEWMSKDNASRYFSTAKNKFIYELDVDTQKISHKLLKKIETIVPLLSEFDVTEEQTEDIIRTIKRWIKINPCTVNALVSENGLPDNTNSEFSVDININLTELDNLLFKLYGKDKKEELSNLVRSASFVLGLHGTDGDKNSIGLRLTVKTTEQFAYGEKQCSLDGVETGMFADVTEDIEGRTVLTAEDFRALTKKIIDFLGLTQNETLQSGQKQE